LFPSNKRTGTNSPINGPLTYQGQGFLIHDKII
jgi:hypothetical protein